MHLSPLNSEDIGMALDSTKYFMCPIAKSILEIAFSF